MPATRRSKSANHFPWLVRRFFPRTHDAWGNLEQMAALGAKHELDLDFDSVPKRTKRFGLTMSKVAN
jgi:hypothetical protein